MIRQKILLASLACVVLSGGHLHGAEALRHILALYDSQKGTTPNKNHIHQTAEVILNHLGCVVEYWDLNSGLPAAKQMSKYRGILSWFYDNSMAEPEAYLQWAKQQVLAGRKFVVLGNIGAFRRSRTRTQVSTRAINDFAHAIGFNVDDRNSTTDAGKIEVVARDPEMVEFERSLDHEVLYYEKNNVTDAASKVYLSLQRNDIRDSESDIVFTTSAGGYAAAGYVVYENDENFNRKWRINPFRFFEEAYALQGIPRPDVTTLNGMRIWSSHIDGDALISKSQVKSNTYCGEIVRNEILEKYQWPTSVSVVVGEILKGPQFADIARSIFELDWVEAASHSYSHPFYWAKDYEDKDKYPYQHLPVPGYTFNVKQEVAGSIQYINENLLPPGKKVRHFFWTGNCEPTPEALQLCGKNGINNINGGDSIFDNNNPSYTSVAPIGAEVGGYRQIYAPNANENIYTNDWLGPYYGFRFVSETFKNTESPVRIKPINIYYHFYSGERWAALNALREVLKSSITQPVAPLFISEYTDIAAGFYQTKIQQLQDRRWQITKYGDCRTIRFDNEQRYPNFDKSQNILGFTHFQGSLYVHLGEQDRAVLALSHLAPEATYVKQASHKIRDWQATPQEITFAAAGYGKGEFIFANVARNQQFSIMVHGARDNRLTARSDINGTLQFLHPMRGAATYYVKAIDKNTNVP